MPLPVVCEVEPDDRAPALLKSDDVRARLGSHNAGQVTHTSKFRPWKLKNVVGFADPAKAVAFEKYLKSGSGRAFAKKRL